jgi:hypothetical protein
MSLWSVLPFFLPGRTSGLTLKSYSERHRTALSKGAPVPSLHRNERDEESQHGEMGRKRLGELELLPSLHDPRRSHTALLPYATTTGTLAHEPHAVTNLLMPMYMHMPP